MKDPERWRQLCEQAITEQDPDKFRALITEINHLLQEKDERLKTQRRRSTLPDTVTYWILRAL